MKIGCVPYGHTKPFASAWTGNEPVWAHPKELAAKLWSGEVDLALVPVWDVLQHPGTRVLDGVAVGSKGEVRSVGVFFEKPLAECRSIRMTPHSLTSIQLWKLVAEQKGIRLAEAKQGEARLLIGDEALAEWNSRNGVGILDLGQAWTDWTGKPFVYAVWALGPKSEIPIRDLELFRKACAEGIRRRGQLARDEAEKTYLTQCIRYELGEAEKDGLGDFAIYSGLKETKIQWV